MPLATDAQLTGAALELWAGLGFGLGLAQRRGLFPADSTRAGQACPLGRRFPQLVLEGTGDRRGLERPHPLGLLPLPSQPGPGWLLFLRAGSVGGFLVLQRMGLAAPGPVRLDQAQREGSKASTRPVPREPLVSLGTWPEALAARVPRLPEAT